MMAIGFADLVGFTRLGERLPPEEFGAITSRFGALASEVASGPVRLVKLIGDAVMLACADPVVLAGALLDLVDLVEEQGEGFPEVRAGLSLGRVLPRGGDFYGRTRQPREPRHRRRPARQPAGHRGRASPSRRRVQLLRRRRARS